MNLSESRTQHNKTVERSPWLTVEEAAQRARCGIKTIYREVRAGRLRAARVGGRRELRLLPAWVDEWLMQSTTVVA
jgi:excisionase family DNA binding protein